ncbi:MAG TPA: hypothetical protein VFI25_11640 [Planctomycetota bacterium]|jgi:hypothetical protein|nr:hypothetical protein [Planctomycetota bacterium]
MDDRRSLINVRDVLEKNSYTATLEDLKSKGRTQVRVVRADQIAAMIEEAVLRILGERKSPEEVEALVGRSKDEFRHILDERERELASQRDRLGEFERIRAEHSVLKAENERLRGGEAPGALADLLGRLQTEMVAVRESLAGGTRPAGAAGGPGEEEVNKKLDALARAMNDRLDRIGRKVGVASVVEEEPVQLGAIFASQPELESNLDNVEIKEQRAGGIAGAVERARSLRRKEGAK